MLPTLLRPSSFEPIALPSGNVVQIPKCSLKLRKWLGAKPEDTYNKPILELNGEPVFAELAILRIFQGDAWEGVWVDTYRNRFLNNYWSDDKIVNLPSGKMMVLNSIYEISGNRSGCFDLFCWKYDSIVFAESKRKSKDKLRPSQINWLKAALGVGLREESFLIVEWSETDGESCGS